MVECHEISQRAPSGMQAAPNTVAKQYQGNRAAFVSVSAVATSAAALLGISNDPVILLIDSLPAGLSSAQASQKEFSSEEYPPDNRRNLAGGIKLRSAGFFEGKAPAPGFRVCADVRAA